MTTSTPTPPVTLPDPQVQPSTEVGDACRRWLAGVADVLIPASATMPAATDAGVAGAQLDLVLRARPDLRQGLMRAWAATSDCSPAEAVDTVPELDTDAWDAVRMVVAGGYYTNSRVRELLGYDGQQPRQVRIAGDIDTDLLERVIERGPRYRDA